MRVLFIGQKPDPLSGGAYYLQQRILEGLSKYAGEHSFFFLSSEEAELPEFTEVVSKMGIDFVWCLAPYFPKCNIPFAVTVWDIAHRVTPYFPEVSFEGWDWESREKLYQSCLPRATIVITSTDRGKYELEKAYGLFPENIRVINYPVTIDSNSPCADDWGFLFEKKSYVFYPAQFWPHKNHIVIIKALKKLKDQGEVLNVVFTGSDKGNKKYILDAAIKYEVKENVFLLGFVSENEIKILYKNALALTYASLMGPSNLPPIEALYMNCPVICADTPGMREQLGRSAIYFTGTSAEQLAEKIKLIQQPDICKKLNEYGKELLSQYTVSQYIEKIIKELNNFSLIRECW